MVVSTIVAGLVSAQGRREMLGPAARDAADGELGIERRAELADDEHVDGRVSDVARVAAGYLGSA